MMADVLSADNKVAYALHRAWLVLDRDAKKTKNLTRFLGFISQNYFRCVRILETPLPLVYISHLRCSVLFLCVCAASSAASRRLPSVGVSPRKNPQIIPQPLMKDVPVPLVVHAAVDLHA